MLENLFIFWVGGIAGFIAGVLIISLVSINELTPDNRVKKIVDKERDEKKRLQEKLDEIRTYANLTYDFELMEILK